MAEPQHRSPVAVRTARSRVETVLDDTPGPLAPARDHRELIENYRAILRERVLRQPVHYLFIRELGKGRQGTVFFAMRKGGRGCLTRHAVKLHNPGIYSNAETYWADMARLARQVSVLQPVPCENLVSRDAYEECRGIGYVQMAALDGIDLQYLLEGTHLAIARSQSTDEEWEHFRNVLFRIDQGQFALQPGVALYLLRKVLLGLTVMHRAGYLHADIKPSNIMLDRMGGVKLVDFGRAVQVGEPVSILLGSPLYMAPETHRLEPGLVPSDLFSVGLVGIELLCGHPPIPERGLRDAELLAAKLTLASRVRSFLPPPLDQDELLVRVFTRFLQAAPQDRYESAEEAEASDEGLRGIHRQMALISTDAEYDREFQHYLSKIADPDTGRVNPRLD